MEINIDDIKINPRLRKVDASKIPELADSIKEIGLLNPIKINKDNLLIAGAHRLEACKQLGYFTIEATVLDLSDLKAELAEIDENLVRFDLHYIDRCDQLARRDEIYKELYPETKAGGDRSKLRNPQDATPTFPQETSKKTSISVRTIYDDMKLSRDLAPEVKSQIKEADIKKTDAIKLAELNKEDQIKVMDRVCTNKSTFIKVMKELNFIKPPPPKPKDESEKPEPEPNLSGSEIFTDDNTIDWSKEGRLYNYALINSTKDGKKPIIDGKYLMVLSKETYSRLVKNKTIENKVSKALKLKNNPLEYFIRIEEDNYIAEHISNLKQDEIKIKAELNNCWIEADKNNLAIITMKGLNRKHIVSFKTTKQFNYFYKKLKRIESLSNDKAEPILDDPQIQDMIDEEEEHDRKLSEDVMKEEGQLTKDEEANPVVEAEAVKVQEVKDQTEDGKVEQEQFKKEI